MSARRFTSHGRQPGAILCRYVERTISQLGDEALSLRLVARHLTECPACRAQRRRVARVDRALQEVLLAETPAYFDGRWKDLCDRIPELRGKPSRRSLRDRIRFAGALAALLAIAVGAWQVDHRAPAGPSEAPLAVAPGVTVTEAEISGVKASVAVDREEGGDGTVYLWLTPRPPDEGGVGDLR